jgi:glycosyltransferase involved in cell wall biosynthesis
VIWNGIDTERFTPSRRAAGRNALGLSSELLIGTAGRLVPVKDQAGFLRSLAHLRSQGANFTAVIAGDGPLRSELEALAGSLGLASQVRFLGERSDIDAVLAALDIFVLSSVSEGMSNTILEAMSCGVPVVATHVGGADELVVEGLTGTLVPASNAEALGNALAELAMDPARGRRLGAAGRKRVERLFSQQTMLDAYRNLYARLVSPQVVDGAACVA